MWAYLAIALNVESEECVFFDALTMPLHASFYTKMLHIHFIFTCTAAPGAMSREEVFDPEEPIVPLVLHRELIVPYMS